MSRNKLSSSHDTTCSCFSKRKENISWPLRQWMRRTIVLSTRCRTTRKKKLDQLSENSFFFIGFPTPATTECVPSPNGQVHLLVLSAVNKGTQQGTNIVPCTAEDMSLFSPSWKSVRSQAMKCREQYLFPASRVSPSWCILFLSYLYIPLCGWCICMCIASC